MSLSKLLTLSLSFFRSSSNLSFSSCVVESFTLPESRSDKIASFSSSWSLEGSNHLINGFLIEMFALNGVLLITYLSLDLSIWLTRSLKVLEAVIYTHFLNYNFSWVFLKFASVLHSAHYYWHVVLFIDQHLIIWLDAMDIVTKINVPVDTFSVLFCTSYLGFPQYSRYSLSSNLLTWRKKKSFLEQMKRSLRVDRMCIV